MYIENKLKEPNIKNFISDTAEVLTTIGFLTENEQQGLAKYSTKDIVTRQKLVKGQRVSVRKLYGEIKRRIPAFEERIDPLDLYLPIYVVPSQNDERITRQDGCFLVFGLGIDSKLSSKVLKK